MKAFRRNSVWLAMITALTLSATAIAATTPGDDEHDAHHPEQAQIETAASASAAASPPVRFQVLQERMKAMRDAPDPQARMQLMDEQMADFESMMSMMSMCPMMSGGGQQGMDMGGMGMMQQRSGDVASDTVQRRLETMEKRMDMMQMMMQMQMEQQGRREPPAAR